MFGILNMDCQYDVRVELDINDRTSVIFYWNTLRIQRMIGIRMTARKY